MLCLVTRGQIDQPEHFELLLPRDISATLPNLPSPCDFSHPSSNYSKQNDAKICSEFVFLSTLLSNSNLPILAEKRSQRRSCLLFPYSTDMLCQMTCKN